MMERLQAMANQGMDITPFNDPLEPIYSLREHGKHVLTSVEFTVSEMCNMRCEHCAVGESLVMREGEKLPLDLLLKRLDEIEHLRTICITGGEPAYSMETVRDYIVPLLKYARERGVRSQLNSNLTLDYSRYELIAPYLDVMHISFNYEGPEDFHRVGFVHSGHAVSLRTAEKMYNTMVDNAIRLSKGGLFVSAESMINYHTHGRLDRIHRHIVELGCRRHEVHPMYASDFASNLPALSLREIREAIHRLLDGRDPEVWMLFGTLPFFHCNPDEEDRRLLQRIGQEPNVTVRNDPDGRNRLNVNCFTGDVFVTDFADVSSLGNVRKDRLDDVFDRWLGHPLNKTVDCYCPSVSCCGPNLLVKNEYYADVDFQSRKALQ